MDRKLANKLKQMERQETNQPNKHVTVMRLTNFNKNYILFENEINPWITYKQRLFYSQKNNRVSSISF